MKLSLISEEKIYIQSPYTHKATPVLFNPLPRTVIRELESIAGSLRDPHEAQLGGIISQNDVYIWDRYLLDHEIVSDQLKLNMDIAFYINVNDIMDGSISEVDFVISDFSSPNAKMSELLNQPIVNGIMEFLNSRSKNSTTAQSVA